MLGCHRTSVEVFEWDTSHPIEHEIWQLLCGPVMKEHIKCLRREPTATGPPDRRDWPMTSLSAVSSWPRQRHWHSMMILPQMIIRPMTDRVISSNEQASIGIDVYLLNHLSGLWSMSLTDQPSLDAKPWGENFIKSTDQPSFVNNPFGKWLLWSHLWLSIMRSLKVLDRRSLMYGWRAGSGLFLPSFLPSGAKSDMYWGSSTPLLFCVTLYNTLDLVNWVASGTQRPYAGGALWRRLCPPDIRLCHLLKVTCQFHWHVAPNFWGPGTS